MCQPNKWWLGLLPLALFWLLANWIKAPVIEADLAGRAGAALGTLALDKPAVTAAGRDIAISGAAFAADTSAKVRDNVLSLRGVRLVNDATALIPEAKPYAWGAVRDGKTITLTGSVPSPEARVALLGAAKTAAGGADIIDKMNYGRGAPAAFGAAAALGLAEVGGLAKSAAALSDSALTLSGEAADARAYDAALALLKTPPAGIVLKAVILAPEVKPYTFAARRDAAGVTLSGFVPGEAARAGLLAAAKTAMPDQKITDETRIARGAPAALAAGAAFGLGQLAQFTTGSASLSDSAISISGDAASTASFEAAGAALKSPPPGIQIASAAIQPPVITPYIWSVARDAKGIAMSGLLPSDALKSQLADQAKTLFPGAVFSDTTKIARGAPDGMDKVTAFALSQLAGLSEGKAALANSQLSISGLGLAGVTPATVTAAAKAALPPSVSLAEAAVIVAPAPKVEPPQVEPPAATFTFSATKADGALTLAGNYPDEKVHEELVDAARRRFFAEKVVDTMTQGPGAPRNFFAAASTALDQLARLVKGSVSVGENSIKLTGEAFYSQAADQIKAAAAPTGYQIDAAAVEVRGAGTALSAAECQQGFDTTLKLGKVLFDTGRATIAKDSTGLLDVLVYDALRCPASNITVAGHTDSDGAADANLDLSNRRAAAVVDYLVKSGVPAAALSAQGFGQTQPVAPNDTEAGKAQNRRIEFTVK